MLESTEVKGALASAVDSLPPQERTVISLYYFEGLTLKEIKSVLDVSESRVSQIHAQAVIRLRSKLQGDARRHGLSRRRPERQAEVRPQEAASRRTRTTSLTRVAPPSG